jgi:multiple sugar transport system ATP-binding protein
MAQVSIRTLKKTYEGSDALAVKGINLEIADGEFVVLVGPSGCGKSTTLRMIAGLEDISSGEIDIGGRIVNDVPPRDRDIAMVFQNYALYPHMSVFDNMAFGLKLRKFPKADIKKRVDDAARILHLTPLLNRKPRALSGGQRQRVAMGRAIVRNPKVFLFDEPLSNLDAKLRVQMRTEIKKVHNTVRTTTVYVTHDQVEAMTLADRVVVMNQGLIEQVGPPQHLYHHPETKFVAGFIGSPGMNFIPCRVVKTGESLSVTLTNGDVLPVPTERTARYMPFEGRDMILGIRPEHMQAIPGDNRLGFAPLNVDIDITEPMGMETVIYFYLAGTNAGVSKDGSGEVAPPFCARIDPDVPAPPGGKITLSVDMNNMHLIDPTTDKVV